MIFRKSFSCRKEKDLEEKTANQWNWRGLLIRGLESAKALKRWKRTRHQWKPIKVEQRAPCPPQSFNTTNPYQLYHPHTRLKSLLQILISYIILTTIYKLSTNPHTHLKAYYKSTTSNNLFGSFVFSDLLGNRISNSLFQSITCFGIQPWSHALTISTYLKAH